MVMTAIASFYPSYFIEDARYIKWMYPFSKVFMFLLQETGYFHEQATKPDTVGIGEMSCETLKYIRLIVYCSQL